MLNLMSSSPEEIERHRVAYIAGTYEAIAHLTTVWPGKPLDYSVDSLGLVGEWFAENMEVGLKVDDSWLPSWWNPDLPPAGDGPGHTGPFTRRQLRLIDDVHAHYAAVVLANARGTRWIVYKGHRKDIRNGTTVIRLTRKRNHYALSLVYKCALRAVPDKEPVSTNLMREYAWKSIAIADSQSWLARVFRRG